MKTRLDSKDINYNKDSLAISTLDRCFFLVSFFRVLFFQLPLEPNDKPLEDTITFIICQILHLLIS